MNKNMLIVGLLCLGFAQAAQQEKDYVQDGMKYEQEVMRGHAENIVFSGSSQDNEVIPVFAQLSPIIISHYEKENETKAVIAGSHRTNFFHYSGCTFYESNQYVLIFRNSFTEAEKQKVSYTLTVGEVKEQSTFFNENGRLLTIYQPKVDGNIIAGLKVQSQHVLYEGGRLTPRDKKRRAFSAMGVIGTVGLC